MSLAIFEISEDQNMFLQLIIAIVATYKFSSFLLPIILLYASIILFMPGWTRHSKANLLASPFCFFTSVAGEYSLYTFLPAIQNATIASFVKLAIILITLLLICIEFMMTHLIAMRFFQNYKQEITYQYDVDIIANEYSSEKLDKNIEHSIEEDVEKPKETFFSLFKYEHDDKSLEKEIKESNFQESEVKLDAQTDVPTVLGVPIISDNALENEKMDGVSNTQTLDISSMNEEGKQEKEAEEVQNVEKQDVDNQNTENDIENIEEIEKTIESTLKKIDDVIKESEIDERSFPKDFERIENFENSIMIEDSISSLSLNESNEEQSSWQEDSKKEEKSDIKDEVIIEARKEDEAIKPIQETSISLAKADVICDVLEVKKDEVKNEVFKPETEKELQIEKPEVVKDQVAEEQAYVKEEFEKIKQIEATSFKPLVANVNEKTQGYSIPFDLLTEYPGNDYWIIDSSTRQAAFRLKSTLNEFKINVEITGIRKGPVVTMFEVLPPPGIKLAKITALQDNIALRLAAESVRIVAPIPGKRAVGIEIPNDKRSIVGFRELIQVQNPEAKKMAIPIVLGKDITGEPQTIDLAQTPHLLIAGATGAGKSVCVNSIILSILYNNKPNEVKLLLVDPKIVELKLYNDIGHLLAPVITESKKAFQALQYCICEMERRYAFLDKMKVRDIKSYNKKIKQENLVMERLPYIVIIIDEFADLMATTGKELEGTVSRLCAMSRAVGIHLVLATQRPSADVITGLIKANIPSRIAFMVASKVDSRIILDDGGADKLLGKGDMLYVSPSRPWPTRIQGAFVSEEEVEKVVEKVKSFGEPDYIDDEIFMDEVEETPVSFFGEESDPLYDEAVDIVLHEGKASASYIQRRLKIGYNRAARILEEMEEKGIVGPANGSKPRDILQSY